MQLLFALSEIAEAKQKTTRISVKNPPARRLPHEFATLNKFLIFKTITLLSSRVLRNVIRASKGFCPPFVRSAQMQAEIFSRRNFVDPNQLNRPFAGVRSGISPSE
jgi:hypothetical protein